MRGSRWSGTIRRHHPEVGDPPKATLALVRGPETTRLDRLSAGDPDALGELMSEYWGPLSGYVVGMLGCLDTSEDVVQETFVKLWKTRGTLHSRGSERALVYEIARNLTLKRVRHQAVRRRTEGAVRQSLGRVVKTPLDQTISREQASVLERALTLLPERRRDAFVLLRCHGLSLKEAAQVMELSTQTVANHAVLALKQLRQILRRYRQE